MHEAMAARRSLLPALAPIVLILALTGCANRTTFPKAASRAGTGSAAPPILVAEQPSPIATELILDDGDVVLDPPPSGTQPAMSAQRAAEAAGFQIADGTVVSLALLTTPNEGSDTGEGPAHDHQLVWYYHLSGCFNDMPHALGPTQGHASCLATNADSFVDANSGQFLEATRS
jgi:hypothetical protein